ncbi:MAG: hypothetical protein WD534_01310 [Phycisphaeraceae bacterium]
MAGAPMSPDRALAITRGVFVGLLVVQLFFGMAAVWLIGHRPAPDTAAQHPWGLFVTGVILLIVLTVAGYVVRQRLYQRDRLPGGAVAPRMYLRGNLMMLVPLAIMGVAGLVLAIISGALFPALLITLAALILQVVNMPTGDPLDPSRYKNGKTPYSA